MPELLFEIFSEEIPARMQLSARQLLLDMAKREFDKAKIEYSLIETFVTPRRLVLVAHDLDRNNSNDEVVYKKGPDCNASPGEVEMFASSLGLSKNDLIIKKVKNTDYFFAKLAKQLDSIEEFLCKTLQKIMHEFSWPKSMRWDQSNATWVRPIRNILCLYNGSVLPIKYGDVVANNLSFGHRLVTSAPFKVSCFKDYASSLAKHKVMLSTEEIKEKIQSKIEQVLKKLSAPMLIDEALLNEVAGLVEYPNVLVGAIDENFLALPKEVVVSVMRRHQKYFAVEDEEGRLLPYFIVVSNVPADAKNDAEIIKGNERVLTARLSDAKFLFEEDRKLSLEKRLPALSNLLFFKGLGNMLDKAQRMIEIIHAICDEWSIKIVDLPSVERAAWLCKADLLTNLVRELPELQGIIGSYYAGLDGESAIIMQVIYEHYLPRGKDDEYPETVEGTLLSIADKLDNLVALFSIGEVPTSSKDPYALRRSAIGIIKMLCHFEITVNVAIIMQKALPDFVRNGNLVPAVIEFLYGRFRIFLKDQFKPDLIESVTSRMSGNIAADYKKLLCLHEFLLDEDYKDIFLSIKRVLSITNQHANGHSCTVNIELLNKYEKSLYETFLKVNAEAQELLNNFLYDELMDSFAELSAEIDNFFDNVMVMDDNQELRKNRLIMLREVATLFMSFADFSLMNI